MPFKTVLTCWGMEEGPPGAPVLSGIWTLAINPLWTLQSGLVLARPRDALGLGTGDLVLWVSVPGF